MLFTSKCTIRTLNVNSTHWGRNRNKKRLELEIHTFVSRLTFDLSSMFDWPVYPVLQILTSCANIREEDGDIWLRNI